MAKVTAQQWATDWAQGLANKTQKIRDGVSAVRTAPGVAAAAKQDKMLHELTAAVTSGKWARNVSSVSLSDWQTATLAKTNNIATGAAAAAKNPRVLASVAEMLADNDAALAAIATMPSDTIDQRIQRSMAYQQARHALAQQRGK